MPLRLANISVDPPVLLAPMAGITDLPTRRQVARFGAGLVVSEMVACSEMLTARPSARARARAELGLDLAVPCSVQIAGREAAPMAETARMVEALGARVIDINMGCPSKRVTGGYSGAALMREPDHALRLIEAVVAAVGVPVTLKMRLGWDEGCLNAPDLAQRAEAAGVRMIAVHGRTRAQFYSGRADWAAVSAVRAAVSVPVVVNGDITGTGTARQALEASGADAVMVGRGAQGAPWRLAQIAAGLTGKPAPKVPAGDDLYAIVTEHYEDILDFYGKDLGIRVARKHLGWYADEARFDPAARRELVTATDPVRVRHALRAACAQAPGPAAQEAA